MNLKQFFLLFFILSGSCKISAQDAKEVLFVGNSYTNFNNLRQIVADIASSFGDTLIHDMSAPGGYTYQQHSTYPFTLNKINSRNWDYVIFQEQSQRPSFPLGQVMQQSLPYIDSLDNRVKQNDSCTTTMLFMTWGRKNGDQGNCASWPPVCTYIGMQDRLRIGYLMMAQAIDTEIAPVGVVWRLVRSVAPTIELYNPDESHPSLTGSYLAACTFYASIYQKSPVGAYHPPAITANDALIIQQSVRTVVFDSLSTWNIDTTKIRPSFTTSITGNFQLSFNNTTQNASSYLWHFGDGSTSDLPSPIYTYGSPGAWNVTLIAYRACESDTLMQTVFAASTPGITEINDNQVEIFPNPTSDLLSIKIDAQIELPLIFKLYDSESRIVLESIIDQHNYKTDLSNVASGNYLLNLSSKHHTLSRGIFISR